MPIPGLAILLLAMALQTTTPSAAATDSVKWIVGATDQDCTKACSLLERECDETAWPETFDAWQAVASAVGIFCTSQWPGNWDYNPAVSVMDGACFWEGFGARCSGGGVGELPSTIARRFCPCREPEEEELARSGTVFLSAFNSAQILNSATKLRVPSGIPSK
ncbi:unnamed protein product, partial [Polarella glacialis]